jgi:hypothetical protein
LDHVPRCTIAGAFAVTCFIGLSVEATAPFGVIEENIHARPEPAAAFAKSVVAPSFDT